MELYIGQDMIAEKATLEQLEAALKDPRVRAGAKDLCLQVGEKAPALILVVYPEQPDCYPESYSVEHWVGTTAECYMPESWEKAAECMRKYLRGEPPFPDDGDSSLDDDCPLCQAMKRGEL